MINKTNTVTNKQRGMSTELWLYCLLDRMTQAQVTLSAALPLSLLRGCWDRLLSSLV